MGFPERAVAALVRAMNSKSSSERQVRDVMKCKVVDVALLESFLQDVSPENRRAAAKIVAAKGNVKVVVKAALVEKDKSVLLDMIRAISCRGEGVEELEGLIVSEDTILRDEIIEMFRRSGKPDSLFPLVFSRDEGIVERVKRYLNEKERNGKTVDF